MSTSRDRALGMLRHISRRDFLDGALFTAGAIAMPSLAQDRSAVRPLPPLGQGPDASAQPPLLAQGISEQNPRYYPPSLSGMRGSHPGSFEVAHQLRNGPWDLAGAIQEDDIYDLVVVGGGISGLAAAYFFIKNAGRNVRVLVIDNHDDFGGHAKRNEFEYNGRLLVLNGGTVNIEAPERYNAPAMQLLRDIGIDLDRYIAANSDNRRLYSSLGLGLAHFFDKETWGGQDRLVKGGASDAGGTFTAEFLAETPLSKKAQQDTLRLYDPAQPDYMPGLSSAEKKLKLAKISYQDYLLNYAKVDKQVLWFVQGILKSFFQVGADAVPALFSWQMGQPGFAGLKLDPTPDGVLADLPGGQHGRQKESRVFIHFPDGNATVARLLVRWLIPDAIPGTTMESVATARANYALLDRPGQPVRIRLNSTAVHVQQDGDPDSARQVTVSYVREGKTHQVRARACVLACWNGIIPSLAPQLPAKQKEALSYGVKRPLVITNVAIRNWRSFHKLGIRYISTPTMFFREITLAEAASLGDLRAPQSPDEPIVLILEHVPCEPGRPMKEQHILGRMKLMQTPYETFERNVRDQLGRVLGPGGFDPAEDIVAITVNRWSHGYAYSYNSLDDPMDWTYTSTNTRPCVLARQPFGLITIANSDAAASSHTDAAILMAYQAVNEVMNRRAMPRFA